MFKKIVLAAMMLLANLAQAKGASYQIDLIVFAYQSPTAAPESSLKATLASGSKNTIPLQTEVSKALTPYHLLPPSSSQLREEYWALHRKQQYRVLLHYSWLQPLNSQQAVMIPKIQRDGWEIEGRIRVQLSNYYDLHSELLIASPGARETPFVLVQEQRLKGGEIYYLDHPQAGMIIKMHPLG